MSTDTPLMSQYKKIKEEYKNEILMYRLGDFYEMFFEDAKIVSQELGLTLTARNKEKGQDVPLAGVPYHSVASYIAKLVAKGYSVAICEQVEDPKLATGIVKREVTRVITPGTMIDTDYLEQNKNNYKVHFYSPFSNQTLTITGNKQNFKVTATDPEAANALALEKQLPFVQLRAWLLGLPAVGDYKASYDAYNQLKTYSIQLLSTIHSFA